MAVDVPPEGSELLCTTIGMDTDLEARVSHHGGVVRIEYPRLSASQRRSVHLVEQYPASDGRLALELSRLRRI